MFVIKVIDYFNGLNMFLIIIGVVVGDLNFFCIIFFKGLYWRILELFFFLYGFNSGKVVWYMIMYELRCVVVWNVWDVLSNLSCDGVVGVVV